MPYVLMIAGLITMCVPEESGLLRFALQGGFGLGMFILGVMAGLEESAVRS